MTKNLEEILYMCVGLLLLTLAFTVFFAGYNRFEGYVNQEEELLADDRMVRTGREDFSEAVSGDVVLHQVVESRKQREASEMALIYEEDEENENPEATGIRVDGRRADSIEISAVYADRYYEVYYKADHSGRIIAVYYTSD